MSRSSNLLLAIGSVCAAATLLSEAGIAPELIGQICGPLVIVSLITWVLITRRSELKDQKFIVLSALILSTLADILLGQADGISLPGLGTFLAAYIGYTVLSSRRGGWNRWLGLSLSVYVLAAAAIVWFVWSGIDSDLRLPVTVYVANVALMAALAASVVLVHRADTYMGRFRWAAYGAGLLFVSDACIALGQFGEVFPFPLGLIVLPPYWVAQFLMAASLPAQHD